ncbi:hypothetical protein DL96DRAFT_1528979 [Flagelloscypha sp. PMI_526]|nr:hypothetical protein DL96DRAFT_1528979 [Flagelloscypha sp. PMI_526]
MPVPVVARAGDISTAADASSPAFWTTGNGPIYLAGICLGGALLIGVTLWLIVRHIRKRAVRKREEMRGAAFLNVKGIVVEDEGFEKGEDLPDLPPSMRGFSRNQMTDSVVLPARAVLRSNSSPDEIRAYYVTNGNMPRPFSPKPFTFAIEAAAGDAQRASVLLPPPDALFARQSFMSEGSRYSVISTTSSMESRGGTERRVKQLFTPVLPDELLVQSLGEKLTVMQSFDDGWTLVGRENQGLGSTIQKSLFSPPGATNNDIELGVIPAWCFVKPCKGLRAERPVRTSSLGITVQLDAPATSSRDDVMSWSNF